MASQSRGSEPQDVLSSGNGASAGEADGVQQTDEITVTLVHELAAARGETPGETTLRLHEHIEPGALNTLVSHAKETDTTEFELTFTVEECTVTVHSDGTVIVE